MNCQTYLNGVTPDEYLLKLSNMRFQGRPPGMNKRRRLLQAQRNPNDLAFYLDAAVPLPPDASSVNVITFTVPSGMDLVLTSVRNTWSGTGFENGAGLLIWKYRIGGGYVMNRGLVTFQNTASNGEDLVGSGGAFLFENQQLIVQAFTSVGTSAQLTGGQIECQLKGWYLPRD